MSAAMPRREGGRPANATPPRRPIQVLPLHEAAAKGVLR